MRIIIISQYGLYSAFINGFIYAFLGSTKAVSVGPTVISAMLTKPFVDKFGPEIAVTLCFYSGCIVSLVAILNLGKIGNENIIRLIYL